MELPPAKSERSGCSGVGSNVPPQFRRALGSANDFSDLRRSRRAGRGTYPTAARYTFPDSDGPLLALNQRVTGSIPVTPTNAFKHLAGVQSAVPVPQVTPEVRI